MVVQNDSENLQLVEITCKELIEETHKANYEEWGLPLDLESYLLREKGCRIAWTGQTTSLTNWGLQKTMGPSNDPVIVSAFESIKRPTFIKIKGKPIRQGINHSIGAVFTPIANRGKGYAGNMMAQAANRLFDWQIPETLDDDLRQSTLLTLWSDVGNYYSKFGYQKNSVDTLVLTVDGYRTPTTDLPFVKSISNEDDIALLILNEQDMIKKLMNAATESDGKTRVAIVPSIAAFRYAHWRSIFAGELLNKSKKLPTTFGAATEKGSWMIWHYDFLHTKINVMRCQTSPNVTKPEDILNELAALMGACESEARHYGIKKIIVWRQDLPMSLNESNEPGIFCTNEKIDMKELEKKLKTKGFCINFEERMSSWPCWLMRNMDDTEWSFAGNYCWY